MQSISKVICIKLHPHVYVYTNVHAFRCIIHEDTLHTDRQHRQKTCKCIEKRRHVYQCSSLGYAVWTLTPEVRRFVHHRTALVLTQQC